MKVSYKTAPSPDGAVLKPEGMGSLSTESSTMGSSTGSSRGSSRESSLGKSLTERIASIDILRALVMTLMIFVNDLGSLKGIPGWLEHMKRGEDGMGLADSVFPAFLFIVGLSLPFAVDNRRKKGDSDLRLTGHVLLRTLALVVMGVFLVNGETIDAVATGMPGYVWNTLCCLCFVLIWNAYPKSLNKIVPMVLKTVGIAILVYMAAIFRGTQEDVVGGPLVGFAPKWWGILGEIGWAYLAAALITVFAHRNFYILLGGWILFCTISLLHAAHLFGYHDAFSFIPGALVGGTLTGLTMGGVVISRIFQHYRGLQENKKMFLLFAVITAGLVGLTVFTHHYWRIAKLGATPPWLFLCSALTITAFALIYWIADVKGKANWFKIVKPAGTDTLLCYLIPYFMHLVFRVTHFHLPDVLITGLAGLVKSLLFALLCIWITAGLNRKGVKLKL